MVRARPRARLNAFKAALFALLFANAVYYAVAGTASKGTDAAAWLVLLILFELETRFPHRLDAPNRRAVLRAARLVAAVAVIAAALGYIAEGNALDAINSALWIGVVVLLEVELRWRARGARVALAFRTLAAVLYGSLAALVIAWAARGAWLDAYDAALWLLAFATIELEVTRLERTPS